MVGIIHKYGDVVLKSPWTLVSWTGLGVLTHVRTVVLYLLRNRRDCRHGRSPTMILSSTKLPSVFGVGGIDREVLLLNQRKNHTSVLHPVASLFIKGDPVLECWN